MQESDIFLQAAQIYASRGWAVFPCHSVNPDYSCTCGNIACGDVGKHPRTVHGWHDATTDPDVLNAWFGPDAPLSNIAIAPGPSGLAIIDIDPRNGGDRAWADFENLCSLNDSPLDVTRLANTGGGGEHLYYVAGGGTIPSMKFLQGVDLVAATGYVIAPPSIHATLQRYTFLNSDLLPVPIPAAIADAVANPQLRPPQHMPSGSGGPITGTHLDIRRLLALAHPDNLAPADFAPDVRIHAGDRDNSFFRLASRLVGMGVSERDARARLIHLMNTRTDQPPNDPYTITELDRCVSSAYRRYEPNEVSAELLDYVTQLSTPAPPDPSIPPELVPAPVPVDAQPPPPDDLTPIARQWDNFFESRYTHKAGAHRIAWRYHQNLLSFAAEKRHRWFYCDEGIWRERPHVIADIGFEYLPRTITREVDDEIDADKQDRLVKLAAQAANSGYITGVEKAAASHPALRIDYTPPSGYFDKRDHLLGCPNGVIDLDTGKFTPPHPTHLISLSTGVAYDPNATCPTFLKWLDYVLPNPEVREHVTLMLAMSLHGSYKDHVFFMLDGAGANGKSTLIKIMHLVLGDYAKTLPKSVFVSRKDDAHPADLAEIEGARFVSNGEELTNHDSLNTGVIKTVVSCEGFPARKMYQDFHLVIPQATMWLATNHLPKIIDTGWGMQRRLRRIRFDVRIEGALNVRYAEELVDAEGPGILAYLVARYAEYKALAAIPNGTAPPKEIAEDTEEYITEEDPFQLFVRDCLEDIRPGPPPQMIVDGTGWTRYATLYKLYEDWCSYHSLPPASERWFRRALPFPSKRITRDNIPIIVRRCHIKRWFHPEARDDEDPSVPAPDIPTPPGTTAAPDWLDLQSRASQSPYYRP